MHPQGLALRRTEMQPINHHPVCNWVPVKRGQFKKSTDYGVRKDLRDLPSLSSWYKTPTKILFANTEEATPQQCPYVTPGNLQEAALQQHLDIIIPETWSTKTWVRVLSRGSYSEPYRFIVHIIPASLLSLNHVRVRHNHAKSDTNSKWTFLNIGGWAWRRHSEEILTWIACKQLGRRTPS